MNSVLDGHLLTGHIDTTGVIDQIILHDDGSHTLDIICSNDYWDRVIPKGSIALDGVSLTLVDCQYHADHMSFTVCIIPYTWHHTNFTDLIV